MILICNTGDGELQDFQHQERFTIRMNQPQTPQRGLTTLTGPHRSFVRTNPPLLNALPGTAPEFPEVAVLHRRVRRCSGRGGAGQHPVLVRDHGGATERGNHVVPAIHLNDLDIGCLWV